MKADDYRFSQELLRSGFSAAEIAEKLEITTQQIGGFTRLTTHKVIEAGIRACGGEASFNDLVRSVDVKPRTLSVYLHRLVRNGFIRRYRPSGREGNADWIYTVAPVASTQAEPL